MSTVTTKDGVQIFYKDWGHGQPIVFHHGWPLSSDDWDTQMLFFVQQGYRVIGIDRRGHGRSSQVSDGHDMDHYAADAAAVVEHLNLGNTIHIGHSTGGGEATRYVARHGKDRVAKLVLVAAVPPIMVRSPNNPDGLPIEVFDAFRKSLAANRAQFYRDVAANPFYGFNRAGAKPLDGVIENWWRQGMMGGPKLTTMVSRPSRKRTSRRTSRVSACQRSSCRGMTTRSFRTKALPCSRPSCSSAPL